MVLEENLQITKVLVADAFFLVREGIKSLLAPIPSVTVVAEAEQTKELFEELEKHQPDIVIFDFNHPGYFSIEDIQLMYQKYPSLTILVITNAKNKAEIHQALDLGVNHFILKYCDQHEFLMALAASIKKERFLCGKIIDIVLDKHLPKQGAFGDDFCCEGVKLSQRETQIIQLITKGHTHIKIAELLFISSHTVSTHRKNILKKLNLKNSSELVNYANKTGMV